jgi:hypothetical protein
LNPIVTQGTHAKEDEFEFNKDAWMYVCKAGQLAIRKTRTDGKEVLNHSKELQEEGFMYGWAAYTFLMRAKAEEYCWGRMGF